MQLAATTAVVVAAADGAYGAVALGHAPWRGALLGAGLGAMVGALFGLLQAPGAALCAWLLRRTGILAPGPAHTTLEREQARHRIVRMHAWVSIALVCGPLLVYAFARLLAGSERIKEEALRRDVLVLGVGAAIVAIAIATWTLVPLATRIFGKLHDRFGLPRPRTPLLRYVLFVVAPAAGLLVPMFITYGVKLGTLSIPFGLTLFFVLEGLLWHVRTALPRRWMATGSPLHTGAVVSLAVLLVAAASGTMVMYARWTPAVEVASEGPTTAFAAQTLQSLTDVDRDGISSLFGGSDCAPFDSRRSPSSRDVPNNGIDEDCDGADATESLSLTSLSPFYNQLPPSKKKRFNVLVLVIDSLRADHVSAYGYKHKTTPHLDEIAKESWLFERAYSQSSTTALSMPSMFAGRRPSSMRWKGGYPEAVEDEPMLPSLLRRNGYHTTLAINRYVKRHLRGLQRPFEHVVTVPRGVDWASGEYIISNVILAMESARRAGKPFFIAAHFDDVHHPYRAHRNRNVPTYPHANKDVAAYDRCIANFDNLLRPLVSHLRNIKVYDDTVLIITSDHGEEFKEHGKTIHSQQCYVESIHVPLIVRIPGQSARRVDARVALTDIVPTLLEVLAVPHDGYPLDGQSLLVPGLSPGRVTKDRPIFCSIFQLLSGRKNFFTRSVRTGEHVLVHEALSNTVELYDISRDPGEQRNVAAKEPEVVKRLQDMLKASATGNLWEKRRFR